MAGADKDECTLGVWDLARGSRDVVITLSRNSDSSTSSVLTTVFERMLEEDTGTKESVVTWMLELEIKSRYRKMRYLSVESSDFITRKLLGPLKSISRFLCFGGRSSCGFALSAKMLVLKNNQINDIQLSLYKTVTLHTVSAAQTKNTRAHLYSTVTSCWLIANYRHQVHKWRQC